MKKQKTTEAGPEIVEAEIVSVETSTGSVSVPPVQKKEPSIAVPGSIASAISNERRKIAAAETAIKKHKATIIKSKQVIKLLEKAESLRSM